MEKDKLQSAFPDNAILNSELMAKIGGWRERIHDNTLTFSGLSEHLANYYDLDDFVSGRLTLTYASYGERGSDKKSIFVWIRHN